MTIALRSALLLAFAAPALAEPELEEIVVTAQKRSQDLQDVPVSVQALGTEKLENLNVANFNDYIQYLPTISYQSLKPGVAQVYMRGVSSGGDGNHSASQPSVAVYLDEQPVTTIAQVLDVHIYDVARIESLVGPQGTLFGSNSQAGTLRIITNKPDPSEFSAGYDVSGDVMEEGDPSYSLEGFVNIPLSEKAAIRLVGWHKNDGGYIDNVPAARTYPVSGIRVSNAAVADNDFNEVHTQGMRAALKIDLNDNWTVTPAVIYQQQNSWGVWDHDPEDVGDLDVERFTPDRFADEWVQAALTLEGKIGDFDIVYAGAYLDRDNNGDTDYSAYSEYLDGYYNCYYDNLGNQVCGDPTQPERDENKYRKQSHEIRVQSDQSKRLRWIAGFISQQQLHDYDLRWLMDGIAPGLSVIGSNVQYLTRQERNDDEIAAFGEISYDLTEKLAATVGARAFETDNSLEGFTGSAYWPSTPPRSCDPVTGICDYVKNLDVEANEKDQTYRLNLSYHIDEDRMVYATWSEGYRPGGGNRAAAPPFDTYEADFVENWELGWKTTWLDNRVRFNGALFFLQWTDFQYSVSANPETIGPLPIVINAGDAESRGLEFDLSWLPVENLTLSAAGTATDAELSDDLDLSVVGRGSSQVSAREGTRMPFAPVYQGNIIARYDIPLTEYEPYVQLAWTYTDSSYNGLEGDRQKQSHYDIGNFSAGIARDNWTLDFFADNVTDERAEIYRNAVEYDERVTTNKPRSFGMRFAQRF